MATTYITHITVPAGTIDQVATLLERCDTVVRHADPITRGRLIAHLGPQATGYDLNLLIDDLGFTAALLRSRLTEYQPAQQSGALL
jgi:hypothetical protein